MIVVMGDGKVFAQMGDNPPMAFDVTRVEFGEDDPRERARELHRFGKVERMAKAIWLAQARLQLASPDESAWPLVDQGHYRALAEAAYDAL